MIGAMLADAGVALGVLAIAAGLTPRRLPLAQALAAVTREPARPLVPADEGGWTASLGRPAVTLLAGIGLPTPAVRRDLAVLGRPAERQLAEQATAAVAGLLLAPATAGLLTADGLRLPWQLPAVAALVLGIAGFAVPGLAVRREAASRRADARHALAAFLDLVTISIAGGAGVEAALTYAAATGTGWAFGQIRSALEAAALTRRPPWETLGQLGDELGVPEMGEMAASVTLAGTEGARIKSSLSAKAAALRTRELAAAEAAAEAATEQMSLPLVLLFAAFIILIGYPAIVHVILGL